MMIKVSNEFLDFNEQIEVEKQIKLFEDISTTDGDFSYAFDLPKTITNTRLLQNPFPDNISKPVYQRIPAQLLGDSGAELYDGYLRVEGVTKVYRCSFFSGNNNWFALLDGQLSDLDLSIYDIDNNEINIIESWSQTEGLVFPFLDNGGLITRSYPQLKIEDFVGGFYVKTIFNRIFAEAGIKIQGELLEEWRYLNMVCMTNSKSDELINSRTSYVEKNTPQVLPENTGLKVIWDNDSALPFFDGSANLFNLPNSSYDPDLKMRADVAITTVFTTTGFFALTIVYVMVNGSVVRLKGAGGGSGVEVTVSMNVNIPLNPGDVVEVYQIQTNSDGDAGQILRGTIKITPTYIYRTIASAAVPNWSKQQFVSNILRMFNVLASYNEGNATLTLNLFEKIKSKDAIDLSEYISEVETDYSDFISDYGKRSLFSYKQVEYEELKTYNKGKFLKYGQGVIEVDNDFLSPSEEIISSDFANPVNYINSVFDAGIEKTNLIELEDGETFPFSDVANDGYGDGAFNVGDSSAFLVGDLVRIENSTNEIYNGDWVVKSVDGVHVIFNGVPFDTGASGDLVKLDYKYSNSDDVFLFLNIPNYDTTRFSSANITFDSGGFYPIAVTSIALAYFDMINTGKQVNRDFIYSLSFGSVEDPLRYQVTMIDSYFRLFSRVLNDPVGLLAIANIPYALYTQMDFLQPVTIKTIETTNQYYLNRMTGYKGSEYDAELTLIKI